MALLTSPTLQDLLIDVRNMLNQPNPKNSFWTDEELLQYLNEGIRRYFVEVSMLNEGHFTTQTDLNIALNTDTVALPTDCFEIRAVYKKISNGFVLLPYRNNVTEGYSTQGGTSNENYFPYYYFRGNSLVLRPTPNFAETAGLRIEYIQFPDTLVNGGDSLTSQISPIFKDLVVMYAVYKAKLKESLVNGSDTSTKAEQNLSTIYTQFKDAIALRSKNPTHVLPFNPEFEG